MNVPFHFAPAYKFCKAETFAKIVSRGRLWFTRADALNDIFELSPYLMPLDWPEIVKLSETQPEVARQLAATAFQKVCGSLYVTCFSKEYKTPQSQLMWAHYADSHRGVAFCIDFSSMRDQGGSDGTFPVEVQYTPSLLAERGKYAPGSPELGMLIGATKSNVWSYEEEVRLVIETDSFDKSKFDFVTDRKINIDVVFDPATITKVIFGLKTTQTEIDMVAKSFCGIGYLPDFTRLDLDPLTLGVTEKDMGLKEFILANQPEAGD